MSVLLLVIVAIAGGVATSLIGIRRAAFAVGLATAVAAVVAAFSIGAEDTVPLAGSIIGGSDGLRTLAVAWAASSLVFGTIEGLLGRGPEVLGASLIGLGVGALSLSTPDTGVGFALLTGGAVVTTAVPVARRRAESGQSGRADVSLLRPPLVAGLLGLLAVAWGASPIGPFAAADPLGAPEPGLEASTGAGLIAIALAVLVRLGAVPAHVWAARFTKAMPASAIPPVLGWGAAAFGLLSLGWVDVTIGAANADLTWPRLVVAFFGVASIVLGGMAAILHDDIEHVLAYAIVQDAGVALLAFASARPEAAAAGRDWLLAAVAVKAGLAAWVLVTRATFGGAHRLGALRGWARRSPVLGGAFVLVMAGAIGLPGTAGFEARATLIGLAVPGPLHLVIGLAAFAPAVYLGRILYTGLGAMAEEVRGATPDSGRLMGAPTLGWTGPSSALRSIPATVRANRYRLAAAGAALAAVIGLGAMVGGLASTTVAPVDAGAQSAGASTQRSISRS